MPSLGATFGRGAATTTQWDLATADCVVIMGSNMAENHPIAFRFVLEAKERGATIIHVDPRFTRTSALADIYAPVRPGSDIAFLGGLIHHILEHDLWFRDYVLAYTNIASIVDERFKTPSDLEGVFSGWDAASQSYATESWQLGSATDPTLQNPNCVYQILLRQYAEYTPEMVERVTGCPRETFLKIAEVITRDSGPERTGAWCYAVGWTHHTTGVQTIRAAAIIQTLLGNIGRPGGGILALRGHASIQGSTDVPTLYNLLPGYLPQPAAFRPHATFDEYVRAETIPTGWWTNLPKYLVSLLRAWYGDHARADNGWGYHWLPKIVTDHSQQPMMLGIADGLIKGLLLIGQNPAVGGHNTRLIRKSLANLEWLVVRETFPSETANFWLSSPEVERGELDPARIQTEIFLLPAALPGEKEGTFTNTHRLIQWHDKVVEPQGDIRSDLWFFYHLGVRLKELYAQSAAPRDAAIRNLTWDYPVEGPLNEPSADAVLREINGFTWPERRQVTSFTDLQADGSTACGVWIYAGVHPTATENRAQARQADGPDGPGSHLNWGYAWPANRRVLYNRASADPSGKPWSERKRLLWWDAEARRWAGNDVADFPAEKPPEARPNGNQSGMDAHDGAAPFIMARDGRASLFVPQGLRDGPLPAHYEPVESPTSNAFYPQQANPMAKSWERTDNRYHAVGDPAYPYVITTYRLTEHHSGGIPTRFVPSTASLQPEGFAEIHPDLARAHGVQSRDWVIITTARGEIQARALVTERIRPLTIDGRTIHQVGLPYHFGWEGYATGDIVNDLSAMVGDPNTSIHEGKAFTCNLRKGRLR